VCGGPDPVESVHVDVHAGEQPPHGLAERVAQQADGAQLQVLGHLPQYDPHLRLHRLHRGACFYGDLNEEKVFLLLFFFIYEAMQQLH